MLFLPIGAFFVTQKFLFQGTDIRDSLHLFIYLLGFVPKGLLDYDVESSGIGGVVVAVAIIHVLIGFYIWLAYKEEAAPKQD